MMHKAWSSLENVPYYFSRSYVKFQGHTGKSERFDSYDRPSNISPIGFKSSIFLTVWPWNLMHDLEKQWGTFSIPHQALCIISKPSVKSQACHAEGPGFAPGTLQGVLFPMAAHHTTLAWQWARDCGALFTYHQGAGRPLVPWLGISSRCFQIHWSKNLTKERSRGEAFIQSPLASPLYEAATHMK